MRCRQSLATSIAAVEHKHSTARNAEMAAVKEAAEVNLRFRLEALQAWAAVLAVLTCGCVLLWVFESLQIMGWG